MYNTLYMYESMHLLLQYSHLLIQLSTLLDQTETSTFIKCNCNRGYECANFVNESSRVSGGVSVARLDFNNG